MPTAAKTRPRDIFTTGRVAEILRCAPRTVQQLADRGCFPHAYRLATTGGPGDRRIPRADLIAYCAANGIPLPDDFEAPAVLTVAVAAPLRAALEVSVGTAAHADDAFQAGVLARGGGVRVAVADAARLGSDVTRAVLAGLAGVCAGLRVVVLVPEDVAPFEWASERVTAVWGGAGEREVVGLVAAELAGVRGVRSVSTRN